MLQIGCHSPIFGSNEVKKLTNMILLLLKTPRVELTLIHLLRFISLEFKAFFRLLSKKVPFFINSFCGYFDILAYLCTQDQS